MPFDRLAEFFDVLADRAELARISAEVNSDLELAAITARLAADEHSPALLFDRVRGSSLPVVTNLLGSQQRMLLALGVDSFDAVAARIMAIVQPSLPGGWLEALQLVPRFIEMAQWPPQVAERAPAQQVVKMGRDVDLAELPIPRSWPGESRPVLTAGQIYVEDRSSASTNSGREAGGPEANVAGVRRHVSRVPLQVRDKQSLYVHWTPHDPEWQLLEQARVHQQQLPVAIALGGDPLLTFVAGMPLPPFADPIVLAGFLRRKPVAIAKARSVDVSVPADADIVLEGMIDPAADFELAPALALPTGFYSLPERLPVLQLTAMTHCANPVLPAIIHGAVCEVDWMAQATHRMFLPLIRLAVPAICDLHLPASGGFRNIAFASIRKSFPLQARQVMNALWGLHGLCTTKLLIVVDDDIDVQNESAVWRAVGAHAHPGRDTLFSDGPADMWDHATPVRGVGSRMGIDATRKGSCEGHPREWPDALTQDPATAQHVAARWATYGLHPKAGRA